MIEFLALYTGPSGPISKRFTEMDIESAVYGRDDLNRAATDHASKYGRTWFDDAADDLDTDVDSDTADASDPEVQRALTAGNWTLAVPARTNSDFAIYRKGA